MSGRSPVEVIDAAVREAVDNDLPFGPHVYSALAGEGLDIVDRDGAETWRQELEESNARNKDLAAAAVRASFMRCLLVEFRRGPDGTVVVIVCDPGNDEAAVVKRITVALGMVVDSEPRPVPGPAPSGGTS